MITTVTFSDFVDAFHKMGRNGNFSYEGLGALFGYLEEYEEDTDTPVELDVIALCCEFSEYDDLDDIKDSYNDIESMEDLEDNTIVIPCDNGHIIIQAY